jgi:hypothetical protein
VKRRFKPTSKTGESACGAASREVGAIGDVLSCGVTWNRAGVDWSMASGYRVASDRVAGHFAGRDYR